MPTYVQWLMTFRLNQLSISLRSNRNRIRFYALANTHMASEEVTAPAIAVVTRVYVFGCDSIWISVPSTILTLYRRGQAVQLSM